MLLMSKCSDMWFMQTAPAEVLQVQAEGARDADVARLVEAVHVRPCNTEMTSINRWHAAEHFASLLSTLVPACTLLRLELR